MASSSRRPLAGVHDRFLAFAFDTCLLVPIGFVFLKPLWRRVQYLSVTASASNELLGLLILTGFLSLVLFITLQALLTWRMGATPGQKIFQIEVQTLDGGRPSLGMCLTRIFVWIFEMLLLGIPLLEILSHRHRRPWHDRIAETIVVTKKSVGAESPHWLEQRFFRNLYWGFLAIALIFFSAQIKGLFRAIQHGDMKRAELTKAGYLCERITQALPERSEDSPADRMDLGLAMYLGSELSRECLESEADFVIWTQDSEGLAWAHLARGILELDRSSDEEVHLAAGSEKEEFNKVCELDQNSPACALAKWKMGGPFPGELESWTYRMAKMKEAIRQGRFDQLDHFISEVNWPEALSSLAQVKRLQSLWINGSAREFSSSLDVLRVAWDVDNRVKVESWACLAELSHHCDSTAVPQCEQLRSDLQQESRTDWPEPVVLALTRESVCHNRKDTLVQNLFMRTFQPSRENEWLMDWLYPTPALSREARWATIFLAAQKYSNDDWLFPQALGALVQMATRRDQLHQLTELFAKGPSEDILWWSAQRDYVSKATKMGVDLHPDVKLRAPSATEEK